MDPELAGSLVDAAVEGSGIAVHALLDESELRRTCAALSPLLLSRFGVLDAGGAVVAALAYGEGPSEPPAWAADWEAARPGPSARIARFARADWYGELTARLREAGAAARIALAAAGLDPGPAKAWRYLSNSGLPEKALALAAGIGAPGRHGLVMARGCGPACVLGLLLVPVSLHSGSDRREERATGPAPCSACGGCSACVDACPTGALDPDGTFRRDRCIQAWTTVPGELPPAVEAAWGGRLYGCDLCLEACPFFRPDPAARARGGLLGPGLPASWLASAPDGELRARLKGSALGRGWMSLEAFRRNARLALAAI